MKYAIDPDVRADKLVEDDMPSLQEISIAGPAEALVPNDWSTLRKTAKPLDRRKETTHDFLHVARRGAKHILLDLEQVGLRLPQDSYLTVHRARRFRIALGPIPRSPARTSAS